MPMPPQHHAIAEHLVVLRAQLGERAAWNELFVRHQARLLHYLRRLLGSAADAEDVVQDVWIIALRKLGTLEQPEAFKAWLYRIARNRALSRLRRRHGEVPLDDDLPAREESESPGGDDGALAGWDPAVIHDALGLLSAAHREVLTLRFVDELSYDEIAAVVGCTVGTVRSRLHYAKRSLHDQLVRSAGPQRLETEEHNT